MEESSTGCPVLPGTCIPLQPSSLNPLQGQARVQHPQGQRDLSEAFPNLQTMTIQDPHSGTAWGAGACPRPPARGPRRPRLALIRTAAMQVLADARVDTHWHVVANKEAEKVLGAKSTAPFLDITSDRLKPLALSAPNPKMACITEESYMHGFRSVLQNGTGLETAGIKKFL